MTAGQFSQTDRKVLGFLAFLLLAGIVFNLYKQNRRTVSPGFLLSVVEVPPSNFTTLPRVKLNPAFGPLDLNRAGVEELERLPGVGPVLARRISDYREKKGGFKSVAELLRVPGIGTKKLAEIRSCVYVSPAAERPSADTEGLGRGANGDSSSPEVFLDHSLTSSQKEPQ